MYTRQDWALQRQAFWTSFGRYVKPIPSASGEPVNWTNYKTGMPGLYVRMEAGRGDASIAFQYQAKDPESRLAFQRKMELLLPELLALDPDWKWDPAAQTDSGPICQLQQLLPNQDIFRQQDWPALISFFKTHLLQLDAFWIANKEIFLWG